MISAVAALRLTAAGKPTEACPPATMHTASSNVMVSTEGACDGVVR